MLTPDLLFALWLLAGIASFAYELHRKHDPMLQMAHRIHEVFRPFGIYAVASWVVLAVLIAPAALTMDRLERSYRWVAMVWAFWRVERLKRRLRGVVRPPDDLESVSTPPRWADDPSDD